MNRRALALLLGGAVALAAGLWLALRPAAPRPPSTAPVADRGSVPASDPTRPTDPTGGGRSGRGPAGTVAGTVAGRSRTPHLPGGSRLRYPRLSVDAPITTVRAIRGVMQVPLDPRRVGWWRDGSAPGAAAGTVVVVGHVNYAGVDGALSVLPRAEPGDLVVITEPAGRLRYRVAAVRTYAKDRGLPPQVFTASGRPRLVLITCGGPFDAASGNYEDNVVVYATPA